MLWPDLSYAEEVSHPFTRERPSDTNEFNEDLHRHYRTLIRMRREHPALSIGGTRTIITDDANDIYAYLRSNEKEQILVVLNNSSSARSLTLPEGDPVATMSWAPLFASPGASVGENNALALPPKSGLVLLAGKGMK
jgi:glycosidase